MKKLLISILPLLSFFLFSKPVQAIELQVSATVPTRTATLTLQGRTAPVSFINFSENGATIGTTNSLSDGSFSKSFTGMTPGEHTVSLYGVDRAGRRTVTVSFTINTPAYHEIIVKNILFAPTIDASTREIVKGEHLEIFGSAAPIVIITVFIKSPQTLTYTTQSDTNGNWSYVFRGSVQLELGKHITYARSSGQDGTQSVESQSLTFEVIAAPIPTPTTTPTPIPTPAPIIPRKLGELNQDDKVDLTDFSILLFNWGVPKDTIADLNNDGIVNLTDFSIMLYNWTV